MGRSPASASAAGGGGVEATDRRDAAGDVDAPRKQRHTSRRIWQRLCEGHGAVVSEATVYRYVRRRRTELGLVQVKVVVPQEHAPEVDAEVDFGEFYAVIDGGVVPARGHPHKEATKLGELAHIVGQQDTAKSPRGQVKPLTGPERDKAPNLARY